MTKADLAIWDTLLADNDSDDVGRDPIATARSFIAAVRLPFLLS